MNDSGRSQRRCCAFAAMLVGVLVVDDAGAGRPLITDDAAVIDRGTCQLEAFVVGTRIDGESGSTRDFGAAPSCNWFGGGELLAGLDRADAGSSAAASHAVLQYKAVPRPVQSGGFGWGLTTSHAADVRRRAADGRERRTSAVALLSVAPAAGWELDLNAGALHRSGVQDDRRRNHRVWGVATQWALTPGWTVVAERVGTQDLSRVTAVGVTAAVSRQVVVDASASRRRDTGIRARSITVGLTVTTDFAAPR